MSGMWDEKMAQGTYQWAYHMQRRACSTGMPVIPVQTFTQFLKHAECVELCE